MPIRIDMWYDGNIIHPGTSINDIIGLTGISSRKNLIVSIQKLKCKKNIIHKILMQRFKMTSVCLFLGHINF